MNSIFQFVKTIRPLIKKNTNMIELKSILQKYNGDDLYNNYMSPNSYEYLKIPLPVTNDDDLFEIYMILWGKYSVSPIHNHPKNGCLMKILSGTLLENIYLPNKNTNRLQLEKIHKTNVYSKGDINYIDDNIGYHSIINNRSEIACSLHIYSPPNFKMNTYT